MKQQENQIDIAVCILFYEKVEQTIECIKSFLPQGRKIFVLNNNSSLQAREKLGEFVKRYPIVTVFDSKENLGVGRGRNFLIENTQEEWLFFVDNDITIKNVDWEQPLAEHIKQQPEVEAWIPQLYNIHEQRYVTFSQIIIEGEQVTTAALQGETSNSFPGGAAIVNRNVFNRLGLYDQEMFVGLEDFELAVRAIVEKNPLKARFIDELELIHDHKVVRQSDDITAVKIRYDEEKIQRSFERLEQKHQLKFEHEWRSWVAEQKNKMIASKTAVLPETSLVGKLKTLWGHITGKEAVAPQQTEVKPEIAMPKSCTLYMTDICNFSCAGCSRSVIGVQKYQEMSLDTVKKVLQAYPSITGFCVAGLGEPTLCRQFSEIVDYLKEQQKYVGIITNGSMYTPFTKLQHKPDYVSISLYGYNDETYQQYCGKPVFKTVMDSYENLKQQGITTGFSYIVHRNNYKSLEAVLALCDRIKPDFLNLLNYLVYDPALPEERKKVITVEDKDIIVWIDEITKNREYVSLKPHYLLQGEMNQVCRSYYEVLNIDGAGNIGGCQRQITPNASFGNIHSEKDPFNSPEMQALRQRIDCNCYPHSECRLCFGNSIRE